MQKYKLTGWSKEMLTSINEWWENHYRLEFPMVCNSTDNDIVIVETRYRMVEFSLYWFNYEPIND